MTAPWISTLQRDIALTGPAVADNVIELGEIAHALSHINRYTGHTTEPWSVAQHSILVYLMATELEWKPQGRLMALLHDAHEAYVGDVASPIKEVLGTAWQQLEQQHEQRVHQELGIAHLAHMYQRSIKQIDLWALRAERGELLGPQGNRRAWPPLDEHAEWGTNSTLSTNLFRKARDLTPTPGHARDLFINLFHHLQGKP